MSEQMQKPQAGLEDKNTFDDFVLNHFEAAITLASNDLSLQAGLMSHYATLKIQHFWQNGCVDDLAEAIEKGSQALAITIGNDASYARRLDFLGVTLNSRYERGGSVYDLESAIELSRRAVEATPPDHPDLAAWLNHLGIHLASRFKRTGRMEDLEEAIGVARKAVDITPLDYSDVAEMLKKSWG